MFTYATPPPPRAGGPTSEAGVSRSLWFSNNVQAAEWNKGKVGRIWTAWHLMCENYKFGGGKKVFNILLAWQSAVTLSPLAAELWNAPSPPVEYINLSALWNLQIKHRGRRSENENVNLAGSAWGGGEEGRLRFLLLWAREAQLHQWAACSVCDLYHLAPIY